MLRAGCFMLGSDRRIQAVLGLLPERIRRELEALPADIPAEEIRFRTGRPVQIVTAKGDLLAGSALSPGEAKALLGRLCGHSVYAREEELRLGFITLEGGLRVGVCGRPEVRGGRIAGLTEVSSFNIRLMREAVGCAEGVMPLLTEGSRPLSCLIAAPPGGGKTTLLRDIARCFSNGVGTPPRRVALADERGELAGCVGGEPSFEIGSRTDVMDLCPKAEAISMLVRSMSPELIVTDEIGGPEDAEAVAEAARCGVAVIASAHASSREEILRRGSLERAVGSGAFSRLIMLGRSGSRLSVSSFAL